MLIPVFNPETDDLERSFLANNYSAGTTALSVKNSDRFAANDRIMIGEMGQEKTEVVTVSSVNADGTDLITAPTVFAHSSDDPVYKLRFDQIKFYKSSTGIAGPYNVISVQNLDVDNEDLETKYDDTVGLTTDYYKFVFSHSISGLLSAFSDIIGGSGWRRKQVGNIIDEVLREVGDPNEVNITRTELLGFFNDVNDDLTMDKSRPPEFLKTRTLYDRTAAQNYLAYPVDTNGDQVMWKFYGMDYHFTDPTTNPATDETKTITVMDLEDFRNRYTSNTNDSTTQRDSRPDRMALDNFANRFLFSNPALTTLTNVFILHYWKFFNTIDSEGDVIETPTPKIYKLYLKAQFYFKRSVTESSYGAIASTFNSQYLVEKNKLSSHNRKDKGTPRSFHAKTYTHNHYRR